jgi:hypothetical protein
MKVFNLIDNFGYQTNIDWITSMKLNELKKLYAIMEDIWNYRCNLSMESKLESTEEEKIFLVKKQKFNERVNLYECSIDKDSYQISGSDFMEILENKCPCCGTKFEKLHYRASSGFYNRILADLILDQSQISQNISNSTIYDGRKYISFTDSRQGTAKIAALINHDNENDWIRYHTYHLLLKKLKNKEEFKLGELELNKLKIDKESLENELNTQPSAIVKNIIKTQEDEILILKSKYFK